MKSLGDTRQSGTNNAAGIDCVTFHTFECRHRWREIEGFYPQDLDEEVEVELEIKRMPRFSYSPDDGWCCGTCRVPFHNDLDDSEPRLTATDFYQRSLRLALARLEHFGIESPVAMRCLKDLPLKARQSSRVIGKVAACRVVDTARRLFLAWELLLECVACGSQKVMDRIRMEASWSLPPTRR